jgi:hypothetical protein
MMTIRAGCEALDVLLTELIARAAAARTSADRVPGGRGRLDAVEEPFAEMTEVIARAIGDVIDRLRRVDDVLSAVASQPVGAAADAAATTSTRSDARPDARRGAGGGAAVGDGTSAGGRAEGEVNGTPWARGGC